MLDIRNIPDIVFVRPRGAETRLRLSRSSARIRAAAARIGRDMPPGAVVGLMFRSEPDLVINWFACLLAGLRPLIMQYPTKKQSYEYWAGSVRNTIEVANVVQVIADRASVAKGLPSLCRTVSQDELDQMTADDATPVLLNDFNIIQLSSGTTGHRQEVEFSHYSLLCHVSDYNQTLQLTRNDRVVSWLPLYHDMGYIACFVMPLMLGIEIVMIDPMDWVREPAMLSRAIAKYYGTVCYMPNFGFEVMARQGMQHQLSMRWWISCSEPIAADTVKKFLDVTGTPGNCLAACYAMAENVFAVTLRRGMRSANLGGVEVMSCGRPIEGVAVRILDGQIWVRSRTSLAAYLGGQDIRDADGFYPTGDLGEIFDGELYVTGRKQDLIIQAGQKFMLSDIDMLVNRMLPEVRGRAAAVEIFDERLGTNVCVVLVEADDFFTRGDAAALATSLRDATGLAQLDVQFVPPRFLTKTSSGKINRRVSGEHWRLVRTRKAALRKFDAVSEMRATFPAAAWHLPVEQVLDSLSLTMLRVILEQTHLAYDGAMSLDELAARLADVENDPVAATTEGYHIISLADRALVDEVSEAELDLLSDLLGAPVTIEHVCLPPSPLLLSDLVFQDYFLPRLDAEKFSEVERLLDKLRGASLIIADDAAEMFIAPLQVYGVLSHQLQRDPRADLVAVRWQRYPKYHHELPLTIVAGADLPLERSTASLRDLSAYLRVPVFRVAAIGEFAPFTEGWEFRRFTGARGRRGRGVVIPPADLFRALAAWIAAREEPLRRVVMERSNVIMRADLAHYCSHYANQDKLDEVLASYDRFCIVGQPSSVAYIARALDRLGKPYTRLPSYAPRFVEKREADFDCMLICGPQGKYPIEGPAIAVMRAANDWTTRNISDRRFANQIMWQEYRAFPDSGDDWFYPYVMERMKNSAEFWAGRHAAASANPERVRANSPANGASDLILLFNHLAPWCSGTWR